MNALPQFVTTIDGLDIQVLKHISVQHPNAMPLVMTHGWPGSILELTKTIAPLTDPTSYGGRAEDARFTSFCRLIPASTASRENLRKARIGVQIMSPAHGMI